MNIHSLLDKATHIVLTISVLTALSKYYFGTHGDYTLYIRIAILCFLFCLILYQLNQVADLFAKGLKSDMIHTMALTDYLTGLYNRTAFAEHKKLFYNAMIEQQIIGLVSSCCTITVMKSTRPTCQISTLKLLMALSSAKDRSSKTRSKKQTTKCTTTNVYLNTCYKEKRKRFQNYPEPFPFS